MLGYFHEIARKIRGWGCYGQWKIEFWDNGSQSSSSLNTTLPKPKCQCSKLLGNCFLLNKFKTFVIIDQSFGYSVPLTKDGQIDQVWRKPINLFLYTASPAYRNTQKSTQFATGGNTLTKDTPNKILKINTTRNSTKYLYAY